jgi:hypothetical protein
MSETVIDNRYVAAVAVATEGIRGLFRMNIGEL